MAARERERGADACEASIEIAIAASEGGYNLPRVLEAVVTELGEPLQGVVVRFSLSGDGTFNSAQLETNVHVATDESGAAHADWWEFPRYEPRRDLHSIVTASTTEPDCSLHLTDLQESGDWRFGDIRT